MKLSVVSSPFGRAVTVIIATVLITVPYTRVIAADHMITETLLTGLAIVVVGVLIRGITQKIRGAGRIPLTLAAQLLVLIMLITARGFAATATWGVFPTFQTLRALGRSIRAAFRQIVNGVAPLPETIELHVLLMLGIGLTAIALYALLVWSRSPIPAAVVSIGVAVIPSLVVGTELHPGWFAALAALVLLMLWQCAPTVGPRRASSVGAGATVGAIAVIAAVTVSQLTVPTSLPGQGGSSGGYELNTTLNLGEDLRRPNPITALTYVTDGEAPYLRLATLSTFYDGIWYPDSGDRLPLSNLTTHSGEPIGVDDIENTLELTIEGARGRELPTPYIPTTVTGLSNAWTVMLNNHTITGPEIQGATYSVDYYAVRPSLEQMRDATTGIVPEDPSIMLMTDGVPATLVETARAVAGTAPTGVDQLLELEHWFRTEFNYSLEPPVADEANLEVIDAFLQLRSGYCVHFASAFAVMARVLGMPSRVVVGFLPGEASGSTPNGRRYTVSTDRLHAWPEVLVPDYGWIPFEPTPTLGSPTTFRTTTEIGFDETTGEDPTETEDTETNEPSQGRTNDPDAALEDPLAERTATDDNGIRWFVPVAILVLAGALVPGVIRTLKRIRRRTLATHGDAIAGWQELTDSLTDLGIAPEHALTPRALAVWLDEHHYVRAEVMAPFLEAVERAAFSPEPERTRPSGAFRAVLRDLRRSQGTLRWLTATLAPASLVARHRRAEGDSTEWTERSEELV